MKDVTVEDFSRLVSAVYGAALEPWRWESALREITGELDGSGSALLIPDCVNWYNSTLPAEASEAYQQYYHRLDRVAAATAGGPVGVVRTGTELMPLVRNSEFSDWLRPYDIDDALVVRLGTGASPACLIVAAPKRADAFDAPERVGLVEALVPHLQQAVRTQGLFAGLAGVNRDLAEALEAVRHGCVIVGADRSVVHLNSSAERILRADDGLRIAFSAITATTTPASGRLQRALSAALGLDAVAGRGGSLLCERHSGNRPYLVHVLPLRREKPSRPRALVLIADPAAAPRSAAVLLRHLYGLTESEADVAVRISRGAALAEIGEQLSVSITTVRKHLQHVFGKTDTHRQADLVRLVLALDP